MTSPRSRPAICNSCQNIDFAAFLPSGWLDFPDAPGYFSNGGKSGIYLRHPDGTLEPDTSHNRFQYKIQVGLLKDVVIRADTCSLCNFIVAVLKRRQDVDELITHIDGNDLPVRLYSKKIGNAHDRSVDLPYRIAKSGWGISGFDIACVSKKNQNYQGFSAHQAAFLAPPLATSYETPTLLGNHRPALCNVSLFKSWLRVCNAGHSKCSEDPASGTRPLRLIDVRTWSLVTMNDQEMPFPSYLALSYVWGKGPKDFALTKAKLQEYHKDHGLPQLPKTISDAIKLTRKLEQRYLWVDSLCIISDDDQDKANQIPAMKGIYGGSLLTIVAAAGHDADAGLPGLHNPRSTPHVADLGAYRIVEALTPLAPFQGSPLIGTTWNTRGWTFQELLLSPRSLIFLEEQVYWRCNSAEWFEELDFDHPNIQFIWGNNNLQGSTELTLDNYGKLIELYTKRKLTFETDILDAFSGIMEAIPDEFFWGIPHSRFGEYLTWTKSWDWHSNEEKTLERRQSDGRFPSWSWMGWKGTIGMNYDGNWPKSLLRCYRFRNGGLEQMCLPDAKSFPRGNPEMDPNVPSEVIWNDESEWAVTLNDIPETVVLNENQAIFWAFVVPLPQKENGLAPCELALTGKHGWGNIHLLKISWSNGVARRESLESRDGGSWSSWDNAKKLIILE